MKRTLPGLVGAILAASLLAAGCGVAQPVNKPPPQSQPRPHPNSLGADWRLQQDEARQGVREHHLMPLGRVIEQVRAHARPAARRGLGIPGRASHLPNSLDDQGRPAHRLFARRGHRGHPERKLRKAPCESSSSKTTPTLPSAESRARRRRLCGGPRARWRRGPLPWQTSHTTPSCSISACRRSTASRCWSAGGGWNIATPVLILTARGAWSEKVAGFDAGADDY